MHGYSGGDPSLSLCSAEEQKQLSSEFQVSSENAVERSTKPQRLEPHHLEPSHTKRRRVYFKMAGTSGVLHIWNILLMSMER